MMAEYQNVKVRFEGTPYPMRIMRKDGKTWLRLMEVSSLTKFNPWNVNRESGLFLDVFDDPASGHGEIIFYGSVEGYLKHTAMLYMKQAKAEEDKDSESAADYGKQAGRTVQLMADVLAALTEPGNIL